MLAFISIGTSVSSPSTSLIFSISDCGPTTINTSPRCRTKSGLTMLTWSPRRTRVMLTCARRCGSSSRSDFPSMFWLVMSNCFTTREGISFWRSASQFCSSVAQITLEQPGQELHQQDHPDHAERVGDAIANRDGRVRAGEQRGQKRPGRPPAPGCRSAPRCRDPPPGHPAASARYASPSVASAPVKATATPMMT